MPLDLTLGRLGKRIDLREPFETQQLNRTESSRVSTAHSVVLEGISRKFPPPQTVYSLEFFSFAAHGSPAPFCVAPETKLRREADVSDKRKKFSEERASPSKLLVESISERLIASKTFVPSLLDCRQDKLEVVSSCLQGIGFETCQAASSQQRLRMADTSVSRNVILFIGFEEKKGQGKGEVPSKQKQDFYNMRLKVQGIAVTSIIRCPAKPSRFFWRKRKMDVRWEGGDVLQHSSEKRLGTLRLGVAAKVVQLAERGCGVKLV
ncbi:hypothetical protein CEXT_295031 [Caerostris extrusa]|uniref:Ribosomal protein S3 n=1 Tax=Caerostris extrusa TaxID=172846 RepID=A0AAV4RR75_CAEEX|nr:hypothetical protein CEXT_295031 [Caerostris extrusa]